MELLPGQKYKPPLSYKTKLSYHSVSLGVGCPQLVSTVGVKKPFLHRKYHKINWFRDHEKEAKPPSHTLAPWVVWFSGAIFPKDVHKRLP